MKRIIILVFIALAFGVQAQQGTVRGRVVDARTGENIEYANVALLRVADSSLVNGTVSGTNGSFSLNAPFGRYILRVTFIGYDAWYYKEPLTLGDKHREVNVGKVQLKMRGTMMEAVEITAERSMVEYQLDKRVHEKYPDKVQREKAKFNSSWLAAAPPPMCSSRCPVWRWTTTAM